MRARRHIAIAIIIPGLTAAFDWNNLARGAAAPVSAPTFDLKIDRQPLGGALQQLAQQCGKQIIFFSSTTEGLAAPAIEGSRTLDSAMDELLAGSGLSFRVINEETVEVRPPRMRATNRSADGDSPRDQRAPSRATARKAASGSDPLEEVVVVGVAEQLVATRIATPIREIPQTISIVSREQIRLQNAVDLADVLENAPGITVTRSTSLDQDFYSRAYLVNSYHVDGGAAVVSNLGSLVPFRGTPDLSEFDHVEILRGADALFGGNAAPGGTVSLVRKRPQHHFAVDTTATAGSWGDRRIELDLTGPLRSDGTLRARLDVTALQDGYFYDIDPHERRKVFTVFDYDVAPGATITAGGSYQWDHGGVLADGVPLYENGRNSRLPRGTTLAFDWAHYRERLGEAYLQYRQAFGDDWTLKVNTARWRGDIDYSNGAFNQSLDSHSGALDGPVATFSVEPSRFSQDTADVTFTGAVDWFGLREEIAFGGDFTRAISDSHLATYFDAGPALMDVRDFDPADYPDPRPDSFAYLESDGGETLDQYGVFASVRAYLGSAWSVSAGARLNFNEMILRAKVDIGSEVLNFDLRYHVRPVVTPFAGVTYALNDRYSLYASYADIYQGSGVQHSSPGRKMGATHGINMEMGLKASWRDGALDGSIVLYRTEQRDIPTVDELFINDPDDFQCCYIKSVTRSRGVDLELSGKAAPGWTLGAGYTYNANRSYDGSPISTDTPRHLLKAWTNVRLPGELSRWEVGGSVYAQSRSAARQIYCIVSGPDVCTLTPIEAVQRSYAVVGLRAGFAVTDHWQVALKLNNAFDKIYYESMNGNFYSWYGEPRNWALRIDGRF